MIQMPGVGALISVRPAGVVPVQPGAVIMNLPACVPVVREPGEANTSLQPSSIGIR